MSATTPRSYNDNPAYNDNLLPVLASFSTPIVWNVVKDSGAGNAIVTDNTVFKYKAVNSQKISINDFIGNIDASGGFATTVDKAGVYMFAIRVFSETSFDGEECICIGKITKNGNPLTESDITVNLKKDQFFTFGVWNTFYERFVLEAGDEIDISFYLETTSEAFEFYIDGMKLEIDDRNINEPTIYSLPLA